MTPLQIGFAGLGAVFVLIALRVPIGVALGGVSVVGIAVLRSPQAALGALGALPFEFAAHWSLSAVPMFLLMGAVAYHTGMTGSLFRAARLWLGFLPGGLAVATNFAAAGFAAASGSSMATAAAMGRLAIPEMLRARYEPGLATAVVAASGTLGSLIPPSILMVLYGIFAEQPIGRLLIAGIVPGLLTAAVYAAMIILRCWLNPALAPRAEEPAGWAERLAALRQVWPIPVLVLAVIGSLYGGVATPTEAAAVGALAACGIAALQGRMSRAAMGAAVMEALEGTASIFFIAIGAVLLSRFLALSGMPGFLAGLMGSWAVDPLLVVIGASLIYLFLGCFLDPLGLMLLTLPVLLPMFQALNLDLVWIGVLVIKYLEIGLLTPPVGMNAYVVSGIVGKEVPLPTIFRGLLWFLAAEAVIVALLIAYPQISLWLPDLMGR
ncbi:C4-dicarboxylate ABC transporter [Pseudoroseomonas rhizosphaerae]|uniref:TRAP transporter large permease protein n=1 Tax=Teichococcus rhizosphaerae TaxID=1335062 RepID=A0A2C7A7M7_9PROT|nr:TRAP transporter large permease [Pseudoroseomonas rhizosphaerae]PHK94370.1 C4-dicarboxylate ABC transporter [Pseudoroseomonas rhizosphaerae]